MKKKFALLMFMLVSTGIASAINFTVAGQYFEYHSNSETGETEVWIVGYDSQSEPAYNKKNVVIPSSVTNPLDGNTYKVTGIGNGAFGYCKKIETITIPETVACIFDAAFLGCSSLQEVDLPGVVKIGVNAFADMKNLRKVTFSESLISIDHGAFSSCPSLLFIELPSSLKTINESAFIDSEQLTEIICRAVNPPSISTSTFCNSDATLTVPAE